MCFFSASANAYDLCSLYPLPLQQKVTEASLIVEGEVTAQQSYWNEAHTRIYTSNIVKVYKVFKGAMMGTEIELITEGGTVGLDMHVFTNTLKLHLGQSGVFFGRPHTVAASGKTVNSGLSLMPYGSQQGYIAYDYPANIASTPFVQYAEIADVATAITGITRQNITAIQPNPHTVGTTGSKTTVAPTITSFSPTTIAAGTGAILTINGTDFGATQGTGYVEFLNSDDGGAGYMRPLASEYVSWNNTQIQVKVPSTGLAGFDGTAGTGNIRVTNSDPATVTSAATLTVSYAYTNLATIPPLSTTIFAYQPDHVNTNGTGGYSFQRHTTFAANSAASASLARALSTWICGTNINWIFGANTMVNAPLNDNINVVRFDDAINTLDPGVLGRCFTRYSGCFIGGNLVFSVDEMDLEFDDATNWNFSTSAPTATQVDFETVAAHEAGHGHQLGHVIAPGAIMHFAIAAGTSNRTLSANDVAGGNFVMARSFVANACYVAPVTGPMTSKACTVLPVNLISFTGDYREGVGTLLQWHTADEQNNKGYNIQRSANGQDFENIGFVAAQTGSGELQYTYTDATVQPGTWYYRLAQQDIDGKEKLSQTVKIVIGKAGNSYVIYPNPARSEVTVSISQADAGTSFTLTAVNGKVVRYMTLDKVGNHVVGLKGLSAGVYFYTIRWADGTETGKLVVVE